MNHTMEKTLSSQATDWREGRRLRAWELKQQGWNQREIANALGVTEGAVSQWMKRGREEDGLEGLKKRTPPGAPHRLSEEQRAQVPGLLARGAPAYGFRGEVWTCERIAQVIREELGVSYHPAHVSRLVRELGLSLQKPIRRANQQDEEAINRWKEERFGLPSKRGFRGRQNDPVRGSVRLLSATGAGAYLGPHCSDASPARRALTRSPLSDERHNFGGQAADDDGAGKLVQGRGRGWVSQARLTPDHGQAFSHLGRLAHPS